MNLSITRSTLVPAVALLTALTLGACSEGDDKEPDAKESSAGTSDTNTDATTDPTTPGDGLGAADETFEQAVARIVDAMASGDCGKISTIAWGGGDDLSPTEVRGRCETLQKRFGSDGPTQAVPMGDAGGVVEFEPPDRNATRAVLVADDDGLLRPLFFDYVNTAADDLTEGGAPRLFAKAAEKATEAISKGDCDALVAVFHHARPRDRVCPLAEGSLARALERKNRPLQPLGVSSDYALFGIQRNSVHWVLVMARQPKAAKSAADGYPDKKSAPTHVLAEVRKVSDE